VDHGGTIDPLLGMDVEERGARVLAAFPINRADPLGLTGSSGRYI
jgi:hypothetical protein